MIEACVLRYPVHSTDYHIQLQPTTFSTPGTAEGEQIKMQAKVSWQ